MKLTKSQIAMLRICKDLGGTMHIFPDQWSTASALETRGFMSGNGKHIDRMSSLTDLGRAALAQQGSKP